MYKPKLLHEVQNHLVLNICHIQNDCQFDTA